MVNDPILGLVEDPTKTDYFDSEKGKLQSVNNDYIMDALNDFAAEAENVPMYLRALLCEAAERLYWLNKEKNNGFI